jgi:hypothetical protein
MGSRLVRFVPLVLLASRLAAAQGPAPRASIEGGVTIEHLVSEYRFENASRLDTAELVPHYFVQHYESTQPWLVARARYPVAHRAAETFAGYAPPRGAFGSDVDTFFQPGGDVATSGTAGDVRMQGLSIDQRFALTPGPGWTLSLDGRYTRRRTDFLPAFRVVTHTSPPSTSSEFITTRETTVSHEIRLGVSLDSMRAIGGGWQLRIEGVAWPAVRGRLVTDLPDKYPGEDIVFEAVAFGGEARAAFRRRAGAVDIALTASAGGLLPYSPSARLRQHTLAAGVGVVFR